MRRVWQQISDIWRSWREVSRARRTLHHARLLRESGDSAEAFRIARVAFGALRVELERGDGAALAILATEAGLLDKLARELNQPAAARDELLLALRLCEESVRESPKLETALRRYIDFYRYRLAQIEHHLRS